MIYAWISRLAWPVALAGAVYTCGLVSGMYLARADDARKAEKHAAEKAKRAEASDKIVTKYVDRILTREVIKYVPNPDDCSYASGAFRVWFDRSSGMPETTANTNAPPVPFAVLTETIGSTHSICHNTAEQLIALQEWAAEVSK